MQPAPSRRILGRYALYDMIASGGMATVHLGRLLGPAGFSRTVAIKRLHPQYATDPAFVSMFLDEARLAARIRHPNVVPTLDIVATTGELFLVMEYVQGESLARLIRAAVSSGSRLPISHSVSIVSGVLHGLHAAHEAVDEHGEPLQIVHRDVSPQNVLVGVDGVARVVDFGVAKAAGRLQTTREGELKGKMAYMAPEQVQGGKVDRRTDVFAASVVLWEALTGKRLFVGENDVETFGRVLAAKALPASGYNAEVSRALDVIVLKGLARQPEDRFATAREMARELEANVPLVAGAVVGEWVERVAAETLAARARKVATIETESSSHPPQLGPVLSDAAEAPEVRGSLSDEETEHSNAPVVGALATQPEPAPPPKDAPRRWPLRTALAIGAGAVGLLGVSGILLAVRSGEAPVQADSGVVPPTPAAPSLPPASAASAPAASNGASAPTTTPDAAGVNEAPSAAPPVRRTPSTRTQPKSSPLDRVLNTRQ